MTIQTVNPATGETIKSYKEMSSQEVDQIIDDTYNDYLKWRDTSFTERSKLLHQAADLLRKNKTKYAELMAKEMGKPITAGEAEAEKCAWVCEYYADNAEDLLKPRLIKTEMKKSYVTYRPAGVIFAIMPWNFPMWQVFRFCAPNLMAGHGCLLKHAPISTGTALEIEKLLQEAGLPKNIFRTLIIDTDEAAKVIANPKVAAVTLTGSERAGAAVGNEAGKSLKKVVLELGGSDPYVVLEDADLNIAVENCVASRLNNTGQVCIAAKRMIIVDSVYDKFKEMVMKKIKEYHVGDPMKRDTNMGPMAREDLRAEVHKQVQESIQKGAKCETGGELPKGQGFYYPPTVLTDVKPGMAAFDTEIFGPVIALICAKDEAHAIDLANDTKYGLAAAVFTQDLERGEKIAREKIRAGSCAVNTYVKSDPRLPFGGIKQSGYGRELAAEGIQAFMNVKTISIA